VVLIEKRHWAEPFTPATLLRGSRRLPTVREQSIVLLCVYSFTTNAYFQTFGAKLKFAPFVGCR
jgi:hypothetical protein